MKPIGLVRLAPGEVGFYDELTRIHLTISKPQREILSGMNTTNIKRSVQSGRLLLVSGSLDPEADGAKAETVKVNVDTKKTEAPKETKKEAPKEVKQEAPKAEEPKAEAAKPEVKEEDKQPEVKEEKPAEKPAAEDKQEEKAEEKVEEKVEKKKPAPKKAPAKKAPAKK